MAAQHTGTAFYLGRIHLRTTPAKESGVSQPLSTQALHPIPVGFTYFLQRSMAVLVGQALHFILVGFTYRLQQRRESVLVGQALNYISVGSTYFL